MTNDLQEAITHSIERVLKLQPTPPRSEASNLVHDIVSKIVPSDDLEREHIQETLVWIESGVPIFRMIKPNIPNKHLVSYFVLFDEVAQKILLADHKKAQLWLPTGGHVEINEDPKETVKRECVEELDCVPIFWRENPLFLTSTLTVGLTAGHTDVSLWYILKGDHQQNYSFDETEFNDIGWFDLRQIPYDKSDPHLARFIYKLRALL